MYNPRFPIYVISKGRWQRRQTVKTFDRMGIDYKLVIEPNEYEHYAKVVDPEKIIVLPENFSQLNQGSIPVRNWVWEHSIKAGAEWHWIVDDNIEVVQRFNKNIRVPCLTPTPFYVMEDFVLRYKNIGLAGPNYDYFCPAIEARPPLRFNIRVYSCILINNSLPMRWRGKYNEDTDLSLRVLKSGLSTVMFNVFLIRKRASMTQDGGNANTIYNTGDNRYEFAKSLYDQHPDVTKITQKFGRWHHHVNYKPFENNDLIYRDNYEHEKQINDFNMKLVSVGDN